MPEHTVGRTDVTDFEYAWVFAICSGSLAIVTIFSISNFGNPRRGASREKQSLVRPYKA